MTLARRLLPICLAAALVACAHAECPTAKATPAARGLPFLWTVNGGSPSGRLYLFGTFHAAGADDIPAAAREALAGSKVFVGEIDDLPADTVRAAATLPRGQSLQTLLGADAWYELRDAVAGVISDENLRHVRPWYAMSLLTAASSDRPDVVMDDDLRREARARGARVEWLETGDEQLGALADSVSADDLKQALADRKTMRCEVASLRASYRAGSDEAFRDPLGSEAATEALLVKRNRAWVEKLEGYLRGGGAFVAVGVGHLVGPGSLVELLRERGYTVERIER